MVGIQGQRRFFPPSLDNSIPALESQTLGCLLKDIAELSVSEYGTGIFKVFADCQKDGIGSLEFPSVSWVGDFSAHGVTHPVPAVACSSKQRCITAHSVRYRIR